MRQNETGEKLLNPGYQVTKDQHEWIVMYSRLWDIGRAAAMRRIIRAGIEAIERNAQPEQKQGSSG